LAASSNNNEIVFIVGPTGTGKSDLAVAAARQKNAVIVNIDSVQTFKHVKIGAAKPSAEMLKSVPHYLFDVVEAPANLTAGDYRRLALSLLDELVPQHNVFIVGGSGFYVQALEHGMFEVDPVPEEVFEKLEEDFAAFGNGVMWSELDKADPAAAAKIHTNDTYRIKRALSLIRAHGKPVSDAKLAFAGDVSNKLSNKFKIRKLGLILPRERLRMRIQQRTLKMLDAGLVSEVKTLLEQGFGDWAPLKSVGYAETVRYLNGEIAQRDLAFEIVKNTMALAKRQVTWFKRDPEIRWFDAETEAGLAKNYLLGL
jgi:tRNA dimethylallyltransferase